jgi:hypothetical protein
MRAIHKHILWNRNAANLLSLNRGFKILDVQIQDGRPVLWVLTDPSKPVHVITVWMFETGQTIPEGLADRLEYIATIQFPMNYVIHAFQEIP